VNEVSDDDDKKTEKEAVTEIKKLDSGKWTSAVETHHKKVEEKVEESNLQKSFKETPLKREVTIVATENEASDNEDKTEKETATEIKKLDTQKWTSAVDTHHKKVEEKVEESKL